MSSGTGNYFMNLPKFGESGGQILPQNLPTGTGTSGYESTGINSSFPPYNFSFLGGKKKRIKKTKRTKRTKKTRKTRRLNKKI